MHISVFHAAYLQYIVFSLHIIRGLITIFNIKKFIIEFYCNLILNNKNIIQFYIKIIFKLKYIGNII